MQIRRHPHKPKSKSSVYVDDLSCPVCGMQCEDGDEYFIHVQDCESMALEEWDAQEG